MGRLQARQDDVDKIERDMACTSELQWLSLCCLFKEISIKVSYGKRVFSMLEDVKELIDRKITGDSMLWLRHLRDVVEERDLLTIVGQETVLEKAWNHLMDKETR
ncbi:unnamed protein product [Microthlaspi erraticum]|uniref:Uncharacterized protein n=1 Tax=Microthlaspi erraticum TaxID=1685480 RepID=A0A6D2IL26_9BRAS|nr:unnamed protein product [Microthlaspi erraticum]